jgi:dephospho-CoA kinase
MKNKKIIGIAGFVGSGKTTVGRCFEKLGADYIDADKVVEELYLPGGEGWSRIVSFLGEEYLKADKTIDRRKLAKFVFSDKHKTRIINDLIHPLVTNAIRKRIDKSKAKVVVIEAVYFEKKKLLDLIDFVLWVDCGKEVAKKRVMGLKRFSGPMFEKVWSAQHKPERIDAVIDNNGSKMDLNRQIKMLYCSYE